MPSHLVASFAVAILFAAIHLAGRKLDFLAGLPRSVWLSAAGGVSVAYVFVHILPELAEHQREILEHLSEGGIGSLVETHVYLVALLGLSIFYGLDRMLRCSRKSGGEHPPGIFWTHLGAFALYNLLIGYLLVQREDQSLGGLLLYGFALGLHFVINDQALREHHGDLYRSRGKWLLAATPLLGWLLGISTEISPLWLSALFALLAGSVILNVLKEELPKDRDSRFTAFALGAAAYAVLMVLI
jgi:hypothetical protein